jgi:hypothetical protein
MPVFRLLSPSLYGGKMAFNSKTIHLGNRARGRRLTPRDALLRIRTYDCAAHAAYGGANERVKAGHSPQKGAASCANPGACQGALILGIATASDH